MSPILVALLGVMLVPLFVATWRTSLLGLATQGFLLAWIAYRAAPEWGYAPGDWITLVDLALVRGVLAPVLLYRVLWAQKVPARNDVIPPNLLSWTIAMGMVIVAFDFAERLVPAAGDPRTLVAVATAGVMLGFLVLATQSGPFSQMIGALRIENAIALFELGGGGHGALGIELATSLAFLLTVLFFRSYLAGLNLAPAPPAARGPEGPTL